MACIDEIPLTCMNLTWTFVDGIGSVGMNINLQWGIECTHTHAQTCTAKSSWPLLLLLWIRFQANAGTKWHFYLGVALLQHIEKWKEKRTKQTRITCVLCVIANAWSRIAFLSVSICGHDDECKSRLLSAKRKKSNELNGMECREKENADQPTDLFFTKELIISTDKLYVVFLFYHNFISIKFSLVSLRVFWVRNCLWNEII